MTSRTRMTGAILILALGLWGLSGCLGLGKEKGDSGFSGTWTGTGHDKVTVSGGCGSAPTPPPLAVVLTLHQSGSKVTGTVSTDEHTLTVVNGVVEDVTSLSFDLDISDGQCSGQANHFTCGMGANDGGAMLCLNTETHCDSCGGTYEPHTVQETFDLTRQ